MDYASHLENAGNRLAGISAQLHVMAAAYQDNADTPTNKITQAALDSVAEEIKDIQRIIDRAALLARLKDGDNGQDNN